MKNFLKSKMLNKALLGLSLAIVLIGGVFVNNASAAATTTIATGGTAVSIDTSSYSGGTGAWTSLTGPVFTEGAFGDIATGTHSITLPAGWEFDTTQSVTISTAGVSELNVSPSVTPGTSTISFFVSAASVSGAPDTMTFSNIKVRPTSNATSTGSMVLHTGVINGVVIDTTNLGTLATVVGTVTKLAITTDPSASTVYGSVFAQQPIVKTQDRFGNNSVTGLGTSEIVTLALTTGSGTLQGTSTMDIGTLSGNGSVTFADLTVGATSAVGTGKKLTASAPSLTSSAQSAAFDITAKTLTASATGVDKVYNASTTASVTLSTDKLGSDDVTATSTSATFDTKDIGVGKVVTVSGISISGTYATNYSLASTTATTTANITVATLTVSATGVNKVYNASTTADVTLTSDKLGSDTVDATSTSAIFDTKDIGNGKPIAVSGISISGADATNYTLNGVSTTTTTANITAKALTVSNITASNKPYDGSDTATLDTNTAAFVGVEVGDSVTIATSSAVGIFSDKHVANGKTVTISGITATSTDAGNYTITQPTTTANITILAINVTAQTDSRDYNGTTTSTVLPVVDALQAGDTVTATGTQAFDNKNVGVGKVITPSGTTINDGNGGNNYTITYATTTGTVIAKALTVTAQTATKVYDATSTSAVLPTVGALQTGDTITATGTEAFADKNVGTGKTVTPSGTIINDGNASANYSITYATTSSDITAVTLTVNNITASDKTYNASTTATLNTDTAAFTGVIPGDVVTIATSSAIGTFASKNIGAAQVVTISGVGKTGADEANYTITQPTTNATTSALAINVTAPEVIKTYDGTTDATGTSAYDTLATGDVVNAIATLTFDTKHVGAANKVVTPSAMTIKDALDADMSANYAFTYITHTTSTINVRPLTVTAQTATKVYDATSTSAVLPTVGALQTGDTITATGTEAFADKNVGTGKTVTPSGTIINDGNASANYSITYATTSSDITVRPLTVTAQTATKVYDDTITSAVLPTVGALQGDDTVSATGTQTFDTKNVGSNKTLTATSTVISDGNSSNNYAITYVTNTTGVIRHGSTASFTVTTSTTTPNTSTTLDATVTAKDAYGNTVDGGNGATAFTGIVFLTTNATGPIWYNQVGNVTAGGTKTFTAAVKFPTAEGGVTITAENNGATATGTSAVITVSAAADVTAPVLTSIQATSVSTSSATIAWNTEENASSTVEYGPTSSYGTASSSESLVTSHSIALTGLTAGIQYHFRVKSTDGSNNTATSVDGTFTTTAVADGTPPPVPVITTATSTVNADSYMISGTVGADTPSDTVRTIQVYNGATLVDTASVPVGQTAWSVYVSLTQDASNSFSAVASDTTGNVSASSAAVVITENHTVGVDATPPTAPAITTTATTTNADFFTLAGTVTSDASSTQIVRVLVGAEVYGTVIVPKSGTTWTVNVTLPQNATTTFTVTSADETGNVSTSNPTVAITESTTAGQGNGTLAVTKITPVNTYATAGGGFDAGWSWVFDVTVPTTEASTTMKFADWVSGSNSIAAATNIRFYSAQSSNAYSTSTAKTISLYNTWADYMTLNADLDAATAGRQIQITVEARVPADQAGGSYSTSYGVKSE